LCLSGDYAAFRRFISNCWWLQLFNASTPDVSSASLREHLLMTDSIYQIHLMAVDKFGFDFEGIKVEKFLRYQLSRINIPPVKGEAKDLHLRISILQLFGDGDMGLSSYGVWRDLAANGIHKKFELVDKVLKELLEVGVLELKGERRYNLTTGLERKNTPGEALYRLPSEENLYGVILEMRDAGLEVEDIAFQTGLSRLHVKLLDEGLSTNNANKFDQKCCAIVCSGGGR